MRLLKHVINNVQGRLFRPVDNSPLIVFRIVFGLLLFLEAWGAIFTGWVEQAFIQPHVTFPFLSFSWLQPLPGNGMYIYYIVMGIAGLMVMLGWRYRFAIGLYTVMWAGVYFMQKTHYNNHYYLVVLLCLLMCIVPANKYASLDVKRNPGEKKLTCPQWCLWVFALQITIVYTYAGLAKIYPDWLDAKPIAIWFQSKSNYFLIGALLKQEWFHYVVAYGGIIFDLLIAPGLIWKKTRKYAFVAAVFFHLFNSAVFQVGVFPYMGIALSVFFFDPNEVRQLFFGQKPQVKLNPGYKPTPAIMWFLLCFFVIQLALPVRHLLFPGRVSWTEEGHRMSWRMMLRVKTGFVTFKVISKTNGQEWIVNPTEYLTSKQARVVAVRPDMCWQFVQILKEDFRKKGYPHVKIFASGSASLNGRSFQPLYDKDRDLASVKWKHFQHSDWLVPLQE